MPNHSWIKSPLGHGETMCEHCKVSNSEMYTPSSNWRSPPQPREPYFWKFQRYGLRLHFLF